MFIDRLSRPARAAELIRRRLAAVAPLSELDLELIDSASRQIEQHPGGALFTDVRVIVSGWACRRQLTSDGARQIFGFLLPGDLFDPREPAGRSRRGYAALTPVESVSAAALLTAAESSAHLGLAEALAALKQEQERLLLDHIVRLGRLTAFERTIHLVLELRERLARIGLADEERMPMPLTQEVLADALGLSIVHVNRTLQQLRRGGLIELRSGVAVLPDRAMLAELCGYESTTARRGVVSGALHAVSAPSLEAPRLS